MLDPGHMGSKTGELESHLLSRHCKIMPRAKNLKGD